MPLATLHTVVLKCVFFSRDPSEKSRKRDDMFTKRTEMSLSMIRWGSEACKLIWAKSRESLLLSTLNY